MSKYNNKLNVYDSSLDYEQRRRLRKYARVNKSKWTRYEKLLNGWLSNWSIRHSNQIIIGYYIADIMLKDYKLVIELDGSQHEMNKLYDENRDRYIQEQGYQILRIQNKEMDNRDLIKKRIFDAINGFIIK